ncbi:TIGR00730 family Rossman fold protein [Christensenellaceae bacterium OttesenSCG-928-L17]|nr:TIGR00730 family Rossman fold protein [Christensenellaceae bacterium OttesenSCG-928-L17]
MQRSQPHICVFASSSARLAQKYYQVAEELGNMLACANCTLVFGGGRKGLMGACADGVIAQGGQVVGVIPALLNQPGIPHPGIGELIETPTMHVRKDTMEQMADAFISLPGGFGTLEELLEVITLKQLKYHKKPIVILDVDGFYAPLLEQFELGFVEGFASTKARALYRVASSPAQAVEFALEEEKAYTLPDKMEDSRERP